MATDILYDALSDWMNPVHLIGDNIETYRSSFTSAKPFEHLVIPDFLRDEVIDELVDDLTEEEFFDKNADLFQFLQTNDLVSASSKRLQEFRAFLASDPFLQFMENITDTSLIRGEVDISGNLYSDTDYLLCHDDGVEELAKGRQIAFILYCTDLQDGDGGTLNLFNSKDGKPTTIERKIIPKYNHFAFFKVSEKSFHEVEELYTQVFRVTMTGWLHGRS